MIFLLASGIILMIFGVFHAVSEWGNDLFRFRMGILIIFFGIVVIVDSYYKNSTNHKHDALEVEAVKKYEDGSEVYINGKREEDVDLNGVNLDKYTIRIEKNKVYLISD